jgi:hypothetical protein
MGECNEFLMNTLDHAIVGRGKQQNIQASPR